MLNLEFWFREGELVGGGGPLPAVTAEGSCCWNVFDGNQHPRVGAGPTWEGGEPCVTWKQCQRGAQTYQSDLG